MRILESKCGTSDSCSAPPTEAKTATQGQKEEISQAAQSHRLQYSWSGPMCLIPVALAMSMKARASPAGERTESVSKISQDEVDLLLSESENAALISS